MSGATQIVGRVEAHQPDAPSARKPESRSPLILSRRIPELDGFRGIAVAIALYFHYIRYATVARPPSLLGYLYTSTNLIWSGMEMFFVLSGFLIGGILLDARDSPNYFSTFYIRRVCRIMPAARSRWLTLSRLSSSPRGGPSSGRSVRTGRGSRRGLD